MSLKTKTDMDTRSIHVRNIRYNLILMLSVIFRDSD